MKGFKRLGFRIYLGPEATIQEPLSMYIGTWILRDRVYGV